MPSKAATLQDGLHDRQVGLLNFRRLQVGRRRKYYLQYMIRDIFFNAVTLWGQIQDRHLAVW